MRFLKFKPFQASKIWEFPDPDTKGRIHAGNTRSELLTRIIQYRVQNRLPLIDEISIVVDNHLCKHPLNAGACEEVKDMKRGLMGYLKGGIALLRNLAYKKYASQDVADSRARKCVNCPHNVFPDKGAFLKWSDEITKATVGDRRSVHHSLLGTCEVCSCPLVPKVFYSGKLEFTKKELEEFPKVGCWQREEYLKQNGNSK